MDRLSQAYGHLLWGLAIVAAALIGIMLVGIAADVFLRNVLVSGIRGIVEYTEFGLYLSVILAAPWLLNRGQHIRADLLGQFGPRPLLRVVDVLADALGLAVSAIVAWYALQSAIESYAIGSVVRRTVEIPEWMLIVPLAVAMLLLCGEFVFRLHRSIMHPDARHDDVRSMA